MSTQHFLLGTKYLGNRIIPHYRDDPGIGVHVANSYILVCGRCQGVWARILHEHFAAHTQILQRSCPDHVEYPADGFLSSASYRYPDALDLDATWPKDAIQQDFSVALSHPLLGIMQ